MTTNPSNPQESSTGWLSTSRIEDGVGESESSVEFGRQPVVVERFEKCRLRLLHQAPRTGPTRLIARRSS